MTCSGVEYRNAVFVEMKTSVYANPAPTLRLIVGYNNTPRPAVFLATVCLKNVSA